MDITDTALAATIATVVTVVAGGTVTWLVRRVSNFGRELLGYLRELATLPMIVKQLQITLTDLSGRVSTLEEAQETP